MTARWRLVGGLAAAVLVSSGLLLGQAAGAQEDSEVFVSLAGEWHIGGVTFWFGQRGDVPLFADWDGDGTATPAVWRNGHIFIRDGEDFWFGQAGDVPYATHVGLPDGGATVAVVRDGVVYGRYSNTTGPAEFEVVIGSEPTPQPIRQPWTLIPGKQSPVAALEAIGAYPRSPLVPWPISGRIGSLDDSLVFPEYTLFSGTVTHCQPVVLRNSTVENATFESICSRSASVETHGEVRILSSRITGGLRGGTWVHVVDGTTWIQDSTLNGGAAHSTRDAIGIWAEGEVHLIDSEVSVSAHLDTGATALSLSGPAEIRGSRVSCSGNGRCIPVSTSAALTVENSTIEIRWSSADFSAYERNDAIRVAGTDLVTINSSELHIAGSVLRVSDGVLGDVIITDTLLDGAPVRGEQVRCFNVTDRAGSVYADLCPGVDPIPEVVLVSPYGEWLVLAEDGSDGTFWYGRKGDVPLLGDWDGDGFDSPGIYRPSEQTAYLTNTMPAVGTVAIADPELVFSIGEPGDQVLVGDWDGNGTDTFATWVPQLVYLSNGCSAFNRGATQSHGTWFAAGEVISVSFSANAPAVGELSIADAKGQFDNPLLSTTDFSEPLTYTFTGTETGARRTVESINGTGRSTASCDNSPPGHGPLRLWNSNSGGEPDLEVRIASFGGGGTGTPTVAVGGDSDGDGQDGILFKSGSSVAYYVNSVQEGVDGLLALDGIIDIKQTDRDQDPGQGGNQEDSIVFFGDWDGNGTDTVGQYRGSETLVVLKNSNSIGPVDIGYQWGRDGMIPLAGTWR